MKHLMFQIDVQDLRNKHTRKERYKITSSTRRISPRSIIKIEQHILPMVGARDPSVKVSQVILTRDQMAEIHQSPAAFLSAKEFRAVYSQIIELARIMHEMNKGVAAD